MLKVARECGVGSGIVRRIKQEMKGPFVGVTREAEGAQMRLKRANDLPAVLDTLIATDHHAR